MDCLLLLDWAGSAFEDLSITHNKEAFVYTKSYQLAAGSDHLGGSAWKESSTKAAFNGQATGLVLAYYFFLFLAFSCTWSEFIIMTLQN